MVKDILRDVNVQEYEEMLSIMTKQIVDFEGEELERKLIILRNNSLKEIRKIIEQYRLNEDKIISKFKENVKASVNKAKGWIGI